jgi:hypothetical protein
MAGEVKNTSKTAKVRQPCVCGHNHDEHGKDGCVVRMDSAWTTSGEKHCGCREYKPAFGVDPLSHLELDLLYAGEYPVRNELAMRLLATVESLTITLKETERWRDIFDEDNEKAKQRLNVALNELRCPACGCADDVDAQSQECGCDSPICERNDGKTLAQSWLDQFATIDALTLRAEAADDLRVRLELANGDRNKYLDKLQAAEGKLAIAAEALKVARTALVESTDTLRDVPADLRCSSDVKRQITENCFALTHTLHEEALTRISTKPTPASSFEGAGKVNVTGGIDSEKCEAAGGTQPKEATCSGESGAGSSGVTSPSGGPILDRGGRANLDQTAISSKDPVAAAVGEPYRRDSRDGPDDRHHRIIRASDGLVFQGSPSVLRELNRLHQQAEAARGLAEAAARLIEAWKRDVGIHYELGQLSKALAAWDAVGKVAK